MKFYICIFAAISFFVLAIVVNNPLQKVHLNLIGWVCWGTAMILSELPNKKATD